MPNVGADVVLSLKEVVYQYCPDGKPACQRKRFQVRALRNGIASFSDRYKWTGTGACSVRSLTSGFLVKNQRKEEFWDYFDVQFPHSLQRNQKVDFTIEWTLIDEAGTAVPFLSTMIDVETEKLVLRVLLPPELAPKRALCFEFANYLDTSVDAPVSMQETQWNPATQSIVYEVDKPERNHKYLIRWFSD